MKMTQSLEINFANGITMSIVADHRERELVYNAVGHMTGDPNNVVATFGYDLSPSELVKAIFNLSNPNYLDPITDEDFEDDDLTDGHFEQREARIMSLEAEFSGEEFGFSFPSSIELEEQPYFEPYDITDPDGF
jgi:hypothetical protein